MNFDNNVKSTNNSVYGIKSVEEAIDSKLNTLILITITILVAIISLICVYALAVKIKWYPHLKELLEKNKIMEFARRLRTRMNRLPKEGNVLYNQFRNEANIEDSDVSCLKFFLF